MAKISTLSTRTGHRDNGVLQLVVYGFVALTLLGAVLDRRSAVLDRVSGLSPRIERPADPPTTHALIDDMLTHD